MLYTKILVSASFLLACYNGVLNVVWSAIALVPLAVFCYRFMARPFLYLAGVASLLTFGLPASWLRRLQLGSRPSDYRRFGVHLVNRFTQDGLLAKRLANRYGPAERISRTQANLKKLVRATDYRERFHWSMLLFFLLAACSACEQKRMIWALALTASNVFYNLYPIWLQQYIRIRLKRLQW